ncbi:MAG: hypothetical protein JSR61_13230 [Proteobacteria bacterium]|nr:hypothetical protein [Pseudomonadota bacterium]
MRRTVLVVCLLLSATAAAVAKDGVTFKLDQIGDACGQTAANNADYRNCLAATAAKIAANMKGDVRCAAQTCIVRIPCKGSGTTCTGSGFAVQYSVEDSGHAVNIKLPSGKQAHYFSCGTCSAVEPRDNNQIPLRLLESADSVVLEIPASER